MTDYQWDSIDGIDDADDYSLFLLIKDGNGDYGWHWIPRETLAENGLEELAEYGINTDEEAEHCE